MPERVGSSVEDGLTCNALLLRAVEAVAFRLRKNILAPLCLTYPSLYAGHNILAGKKSAAIEVGELIVQSLGTAAALAACAALFRIKMIVSGHARDDFPLAGDPHAFQE